MRKYKQTIEVSGTKLDIITNEKSYASEPEMQVFLNYYPSVLVINFDKKKMPHQVAEWIMNNPYFVESALSSAIENNYDN